MERPNGSESQLRMDTSEPGSDDLPSLNDEELSLIAAVQKFLPEDLELVESLGYGSQGEVQLMKGRFYGKVALKLFLSDDDRKFALNNYRELVLSQKLTFHPHIMSFYGFYHIEMPMDATVVPNGFIMEFMEGGNLQGVTLTKNPNDYHLGHVLNWTRQAAMALAYCHRHGIMHRDVKPSNMMLSASKLHLKLCDFGSARQMSRKTKTAKKGTINYMSPEMIEGLDYDNSVDVYSFGISIWQMIYKQAPFNGKSEFVVYREVKSGNRPSMVEAAAVAGVGDELRSIISRCWNGEAKLRPAMEELLIDIEPLCVQNRLESLLVA